MSSPRRGARRAAARALLLWRALGGRRPAATRDRRRVFETHCFGRLLSPLLDTAHDSPRARRRRCPPSREFVTRAYRSALPLHEWLRRLKVELLRESPSPVLRACSALAQAHQPLAHDLFHAAFVSCWNELNEQYQESLVRALQTAFRSTTIPPEILQTLLNLTEFMEHDAEQLPISSPILAELAQKSHAYAKALHYRCVFCVCWFVSFLLSPCSPSFSLNNR